MLKELIAPLDRFIAWTHTLTYTKVSKVRATASKDSGTVVEKSVSNQKVASSIPCRRVLEQDTEPLISPDVQCTISHDSQLNQLLCFFDLRADCFHYHLYITMLMLCMGG